MTTTDIKSETDKDPLLNKFRQFVRNGWPVDDPTCEKDLQPYFKKKDELSGKLDAFYGVHVLSFHLYKCRERIVKELNDSHPGISCIKSLAREYVWWPGLDQQLEEQVRNCATCQQARNKPAAALLHHWEWPERQWVRLHIDYVGPCFGKYFLL